MSFTLPTLQQVEFLLPQTQETYPITHGEYLIPNLWVNRNTGTREYYELMWHDGKNYHLIEHYFADRGQTIDDDELYRVHTLALCSALLDPTIPFNLTICRLE